MSIRLKVVLICKGARIRLMASEVRVLYIGDGDKVVFDEMLSCLVWGVGPGGCLIKYLGYQFKAWEFSFFPEKVMGVKGRF